MTPDYIRAGPFVILPKGVSYPECLHPNVNSDALWHVHPMEPLHHTCPYCKTISRAERRPSCGAPRREL